MNPEPVIRWQEGGEERSVPWRSESGLAPPSKVIVGDDQLSADEAVRLAAARTGILWRGDYNNARHLLDAMARRIDRRLARPGARTKTSPRKATAAKAPAPSTALVAFEAHRRKQAERARMLAMVLLPFEPGHVIPLRRAPDARLASEEAHGVSDMPYVTPLRELLGIVGAHEYRKRGVEVAALGGRRIHPHYGVFAPIRSEYVDLVARAPIERGTPQLAFDVGTGTGVLAAVLAHRGVQRIIATDNDPRAISCASENLARLGIDARVELLQGELFPSGRAPLVVCNPPWLPGRPSASIERAVYDPDSRMLKGFLDGLAAHLEPGGEGWLILSDFAERLGLRTREALLEWVRDAGLRVIDRIDTRPRHPKSADATDPLHEVRSAEVTSLWRLAAATT